MLKAILGMSSEEESKSKESKTYSDKAKHFFQSALLNMDWKVVLVFVRQELFWFGTTVKPRFRVVVQMLALFLEHSHDTTRAEYYKYDSQELLDQFLSWLTNYSRLKGVWFQVYAKEWMLFLTEKKKGKWFLRDVGADMQLECQADVPELRKQQLVYCNDSSKSIIVDIPVPERWQDIQYLLLELVQKVPASQDQQYMISEEVYT